MKIQVTLSATSPLELQDWAEDGFDPKLSADRFDWLLKDRIKSEIDPDIEVTVKMSLTYILTAQAVFSSGPPCRLTFLEDRIRDLSNKLWEQSNLYLVYRGS